MEDTPEPSRAIFDLIVSNFADDPWVISVYLLAFVVLVFLSGLISGSEVAFFSLSGDQLFDLQKSKKKIDHLVLELLGKPKQLLASILIANNLVNVAIVTISTMLTWKVTGSNSDANPLIIISSLVVTFLIVFFGEVIPKIYANKENLSFAYRTAHTLQLINKVFYPLGLMLLGISNLIEKRIEAKGYDVSVDDLNEALEMTTEESTEEEKDILKGVVKFGTIHVKQIMRSRLDITAVDESIDFHQLMDKINKCGFSRIPVYKDSIDHIVGVLYIKDILPYIDRLETYPWQKLVREPYFIPENKKIDDLLRRFQSMRVHMAIVVDEYAGTAGLITLEDVIEEIVGDIHDEFDQTDVEFKKINDTTYIFEGKTSLNDLTKIIDVDINTFDEIKGESESLAGLLLEINSEMPNAGDQIAFENFSFVVESASNKRIKRVKIQINENEVSS